MSLLHKASRAVALAAILLSTLKSCEKSVRPIPPQDRTAIIQELTDGRLLKFFERKKGYLERIKTLLKEGRQDDALDTYGLINRARPY